MSNPADAEAHSHWLAERPASDAPSRGEAEADLAEDEADREWFEAYRARRRAADDDELRDGLAGWGEK